MQGSLGGVTFRQFRFDSRLHQSSELRKKSLTDRILMALRGLVWVDASANRAATAYTSAPLCNRRLTQKRTLRRRRHRDVTEGRTLGGRRHGKAHFASGPHRRAHSACERWLRREPIFADLRTLLRPHVCPQRRNSVHKCPDTAPRGHFRQSVYTPASPPSGEAHVAGVVTQPPIHTNSRSLWDIL